MLAETFMRFLAASITSRRDGLAFVNGSRERLTSYTPARVVCECTERKVSGAGQTWSRGLLELTSVCERQPHMGDIKRRWEPNVRKAWWKLDSPELSSRYLPWKSLNDLWWITGKRLVSLSHLMPQARWQIIGFRFSWHFVVLFGKVSFRAIFSLLMDWLIDFSIIVDMQYYNGALCLSLGFCSR